MTGKMFILLTAVLAAPALHAQQRSREQLPQQSLRILQEQQARQAAESYRSLERGDQQAWIHSIANQQKLRAALVAAWQQLGMSPQAAQVVASAYKPERAQRLHHASLRGKDDQQIAAMLQSALHDKDYLLANQLLIDYQRERLRLSASTSPAGH